MQIVTVRNGESEEGDRLIDGAYLLRAQVFGERLGWDVTVRDGRERDEYDALKPTYLIVASDRLDRVMGCARLLPGTGPIMLRGTFPTLVDSGHIPHSTDFAESSRFCVDTRCRIGARHGSLHETTLSLLAGILEWADAHRYSRVVTATDLRFERILRRAGLPFHRLGEPRQIGNTAAVAGMVYATTDNMVRLRSAARQAPFRRSVPHAA